MKQLIYRILLLSTLLIAAIPSFAQLGTYGNEWIDYSKTYYKFHVGAEGIYRITGAALSAAGVPATVAGGQFILYKYGQEVPVYTSTAGAFSSTDYIEFYGTKNDGRQDEALYPAGQQLNDKMSLFTDTAAYFLTYDNQTTHQRYTLVNNSIPTGATSIPYCYYKTGVYYKNSFYPGRTINSQYLFYLSEFDNGEGFIDGQKDLATVSPINIALTELVSSAGVNASLSTNITGVSTSNNHSVRLYLNNQQVADSSYGVGETQKFNLTVPANILTTNSEVKFQHYNIGAASYDKYGVAHVEITYPRSLNVSGLHYFHFSLNANSASQYLEFSNFNNGSTTPRLYDITNQTYYTADLAVSGKTRFYINGSVTNRELVLYAPSGSNVYQLSPIKSFQFKDYTQAANQGNYIIITHPDLDVSTNGHNYVSDYSSYRASVDGGSYQPIIVDINELYDQFAYGTVMHPLSIRHFLQYAYNTWSTRPDYVFFIGHGLLYFRYDQYLTNRSTYQYPVMPVWGHPGSDIDFVNFLPNRLMSMGVGRLSAWTPQEVGSYLDKLKGYEAAIPSASLPTVSSEFWKKQVLHIAGGGDTILRLILKQNLDGGANVIRDSAFGAQVTSVYKNSTAQIETIDNAAIDSMVNNGLGIITFHGHASSGSFDFNLNDPEKYNSAPRLPLFIALGCDVAQIFELSNQKTISERYIDAPTGGSIAMFASSTEGFTDFHGTYIRSLYAMIGKKDYGAPLGRQFADAYDSIRKLVQTDHYFAHLEANFIQGDPALKMYGPDKPDFHISAGSMSTTPYNVTTNLDSFGLKIVAYNLARAYRDTVMLRIEHIHPQGNTTVVSTYPVVRLFNTDTSIINIAIDPLNDLGLNKYRVTIDPANTIEEVSENNNTATIDVFIYSDQLVPVYPSEFSIVGQPGITLKASTINPFRPAAQYRMEIDTTENFNSPQKQSTTITSKSGVVKWQPPISFSDSTVYYWRAAFDSAINGSYLWSGSSFIYINQSSEGWNQSHYYQFLKDDFDNLTLNDDRIFRYRKVPGKIQVKNKIMLSSTDVDNSKVVYNDYDIQRSACLQQNTLQILVFDSLTGAPWENYAGHPAGAVASCASQRGVYSFDFPLTDQTYRNRARRFLDSIPDGNYILIKNVIYDPVYSPSYANDWKADTLVYGSGNSIYHALIRVGFTLADSVNGKKVFAFFTQKGNADYNTFQEITDNNATATIIDEEFNPAFYDVHGTLQSTTIGPATDWKQLKWAAAKRDGSATTDSMYVRIIGIDTASIEQQLYIGTSKDTSISFINAATYPYLRMEWTSYDTMGHESPQLDYWRILYNPAPEAALNPAAYFSFADSVQVGQNLELGVAIENLTAFGMDSMLVRYRVIDANGQSHDLASRRYKPLPGNDTLQAQLNISVDNYVGNNVLYIEANPNNDQPEQYHPNNLGYLPFIVNKDLSNPLLDVTFDGVHILDKDIVSAKPFIKILLKDENQYLAIDDTSLLTVYIRYPNEQVSRQVPFDGVTCKFIPADITSGKNEAYIEYRPSFTKDSTYQLTVSAQDKTGNNSGGANKTDYQISFNVYNKPAITRILNYPNPFSTSTAFLFTLTGSEIPSQFKIQIMTVTGKVVREITKDQLGPLHIGRNITEYKWNGTDEYGQMLGNGVYLYRVVTTINGNALDKWSTATGAEEKYFTKGYGKMYIMR